jgi:ferredoxin-NADP reductase
MEKIVRILAKEHLTHDVIRLVLEKPDSVQFHPGQAIDLSINEEAWKKELRPFTFTSLPSDNVLELTIKTYPDHHGVTERLLSLEKDDELLLHDVFGSIGYKGEGIFIAGGAGVTPFISIFKQLEAENKVGNSKLMFANKTKGDIILESYFTNLLGENFINVLSEEDIEGYEHGYINQEILKKYKDENIPYYYLCGPEPMMDAVEASLVAIGVDAKAIIKEDFS